MQLICSFKSITVRSGMFNVAVDNIGLMSHLTTAARSSGLRSWSTIILRPQSLLGNVKDPKNKKGGLSNKEIWVIPGANFGGVV
jgi:hypothetical protein